jgi:hypothetical protein
MDELFIVELLQKRARIVHTIQFFLSEVLMNLTQEGSIHGLMESKDQVEINLPVTFTEDQIRWRLIGV